VPSIRIIVAVGALVAAAVPAAGHDNAVVAAAIAPTTVERRQGIAAAPNERAIPPALWSGHAAAQYSGGAAHEGDTHERISPHHPNQVSNRAPFLSYMRQRHEGYTHHA
jgi:hypothetical protein